MLKKSRLLSVRISIYQMNLLKNRYEKHKKQIAEHCPGIDVQCYKFSDYLRDTLKLSKRKE